MKKILIPNHGPNQETLSLAINKAIEECENFECNNFILVTPKKDNLESLYITTHLGRDNAKTLKKGGKVFIEGTNIFITHESSRTVESNSHNTIALAMHIPAKDIEKLSEMYFSCLIYIPWLQRESDLYQVNDDWITITQS